jgi:soluble lytic murein transglycosylase-like protein
MRPIVTLAILLLGLKAAFPQVEFGAKFGSLAELPFGDAKFQDRVPATDDDLSSSDVDATGAIGEAENSQFEIRALTFGPLQESASEAKKSDRLLALLTPLAIAASDTAHDQDEATSEPPPPTPATTNADADANVADSIGGLCHALMTSAQDNDLPVPFFANLIWQESRLQRDSISRAGALGIAQFMPEVATEVGLADPFDPRQAIPASARFLKVLRQQFGNLGYVAAAYNAGAHRVGEWLDRRRALPQETRTYVLRVTGRSAETWRKSPPNESKLGFEHELPCRVLPAFAELEQAQLRDAPQSDDTQDARPQQDKIATRVAHLIARKVVVKVAAKAAARARGARFAARVAAKAAATAAQPAGSSGSVVHPVVTAITTAAKPSGRTVNLMARNFHARRDALRRPQPVPREKRRLA